MWQVLADSASVKAACDTLLGEYDVEPEELERDLENLIEQLRAHGLLETTES
jgi:hypothetical protein